jgi:hypothetical protein
MNVEQVIALVFIIPSAAWLVWGGICYIGFRRQLRRDADMVALARLVGVLKDLDPVEAQWVAWVNSQDVDAEWRAMSERGGWSTP